jgi:hypothetical protein
MLRRDFEGRTILDKDELMDDEVDRSELTNVYDTWIERSQGLIGRTGGGIIN